ncbi:ubiquinone/menaquinone biosynthesis methyltransferase [Nitzschia inconspicua]|uniref:Ubiquinone/menaquinone biosynthesis methyltransferase n=1 Tax=Nitzschia inconspicua TaxID=303405 RepID=A0A9K3Q865_9STRA|nr:ubiquinone/menaquinone biosynthesis methyltransferase [Nitzschia inconspicua]
MITSFIIFPPSDKEMEDPSLMDAYLTYTPYQPQATWLSDFKVLKAMYVSKITGDDLQERLNSFYDQQADLYDSYRVRMLHGRPLMLKAVARHTKPTASLKKKGLVWVDLACGTGYNVESFKTCLDKFHAIYLLDLCVPLTKVAQRERADKYNDKSKNHQKIQVIHGDATDFDCPGLPEAGTADIVTISYSLVMIPDWRKAIVNAKRLLKSGGKGMIAVSDFTLDPDQRSVMKTFWKSIFAKDHVFLNEEHLQTLHDEFDVVEAAGAYGPLPYTPSFLQPAYYHFCGTTKMK